MAGINSVAIVGRLTRDIEEKSTQSGKKVANFTLAVDGYNKDAPADFINCVAWGNVVDVLTQWTSKGKQLAVTGRLSTSSYEAKDGTKRYKTEVVVRDLQLIGNRAPDRGQEEVNPSDYEDGNPDENAMSEAPF